MAKTSKVFGDGTGTNGGGSTKPGGSPPTSPPTGGKNKTITQGRMRKL